MIEGRKACLYNQSIFFIFDIKKTNGPSYIRNLGEMVRFLYPIIRQIVTLFPSRPPPPTPHGSQHWRQIHVLTYYRMGRSWIISTLLAFVTYVMPLREWVRFASHKLKCTLVLECLDIFSDTMSKDTISQKGHVFWIHIWTGQCSQSKWTHCIKSGGGNAASRSREFLWTTSLPEMEGPLCPLAAFSQEILSLRAHFPFK